MKKIILLLTLLQVGCTESQDVYQSMEVFDIGTRYEILSSVNNVEFKVFYTKGYQYIPDRKTVLAECEFQANKIAEKIAIDLKLPEYSLREVSREPIRNILSGETSCEAYYIMEQLALSKG